MKRTKRWLVIGIVVAAVAAISVGVVSAHGGGWFGSREKVDSYLAEELGVTVEELEAAQQAAQDRALEDAYAAGDIDEDQYQMIQTQKALRDYIDPQAMTSDALGISVDELAEKPLNEWLDELGLDRADFIAQMRAAHEAAISQAVMDGVITQEQADLLGEMRGGRIGGRMPGGRMPRGGFDGDCPEGNFQRDGSFERGPATSGNDA